MRVFLAGATGVIGRRLLPLLVAAGHDVAGTTRSRARSDSIAEQGAVPVVVDVYDLAVLSARMADFAPDIVLHELTDLPDDPAEVALFAAHNARIRVEGTANLIAAARSAGVSRLVAQSIAWAPQPGVAADAVAELERTVLAFGGTVLRYGQFYGPGTFFPDHVPGAPRVEIDAAARRTVEALDLPSGVFEITDDGVEPR